MSKQLRHEDFQALLHEPVTLTIGEISLPATIAEVNVSQRHGDAEREPFSVILITETEHSHGQAIYALQHERLGSVELFLVPLGPKSGGMSYEAIFT
ncbi:MAG: hypothetical protein KKC01_00625 [Gammaproteobacteria bacterium]|nr:hypothetical protein [Gammaproteobacteria bacterium]